MPSGPSVVDPRAVEAQDLPPEVAAWARRQAMRPLRLFGSVLLAAGFVVFMGWLSHALDQPTRFDEDLAAATHPSKPEPWSPSYALDPAVVASIDFEVVHARLLPEWVISLQHDPYALGRDREQRRFEALTSEAGKDANLSSLLRRLRDRATVGVSVHALEITYLLNGWNDYMQQAGLPWHVAHDLVETARGGRMYARCYRVHADVQVPVSGAEHNVRVLSRVDGTNVGELFFGQTSVEERRAMVVSDRVAEFALERLWPMMDAGSAQRLSGMDRAFAPSLRREARNVLAPATLETLERGASLRLQLLDRLADIATRKACGRGIEVENMPWDGLSARGRAIVARAADHNERKRCGRLTQEDANFLLSASDALSKDQTLRGALGQLAAWLARAVAVHEVRHLADGVHAGDLSCEGCPPAVSFRTKAEVSAYVASLATDGVGYLALYQACGVDLPAPHDSGGALRFVLGVVAPEGCDAVPPANLYAQARLLDWILFKRVQRIEMPETFPREVALPAVRTSLSTPGFEAVAEGMLRTRHTMHPTFPMRAL